MATENVQETEDDPSGRQDPSSPYPEKEYWGDECSPDSGPPPPGAEGEFLGSDEDINTGAKTKLEVRGLEFQWGSFKLHVSQVRLSLSTKLIGGLIAADIFLRYIH